MASKSNLSIYSIFMSWIIHLALQCGRFYIIKALKKSFFRQISTAFFTLWSWCYMFHHYFDDSLVSVNFSSIFLAEILPNYLKLLVLRNTSCNWRSLVSVNFSSIFLAEVSKYSSSLRSRKVRIILRINYSLWQLCKTYQFWTFHSHNVCQKRQKVNM